MNHETAFAKGFSQKTVRGFIGRLKSVCFPPINTSDIFPTRPPSEAKGSPEDLEQFANRFKLSTKILLESLYDVTSDKYKLTSPEEFHFFTSQASVHLARLIVTEHNGYAVKNQPGFLSHDETHALRRHLHPIWFDEEHTQRQKTLNQNAKEAVALLFTYIHQGERVIETMDVNLFLSHVRHPQSYVGLNIPTLKERLLGDETMAADATFSASLL